MPKYTGVIVAVEQYNSSEIKPVTCAVADAQGLYDALINLGGSHDDIDLLINHHATRTTILEKLKQRAQYARPSDIIIFYFAGHGFYDGGENLISCADTLLSAIKGTTIDINSILSTLDESGSSKAIAFLDCCHSGIEFSKKERSPISDFATDQLKYEYSDAEHLAVFASCKSNEKSQVDLDRRHGVWSYFLLEALNGRARGIYDSAILFSDKLQKYLAENVPQRVKLITPEKKNQTPVKFGKETTEKFIVADLTKIFAEQKSKAQTEDILFGRTNVSIIASEDGWVTGLPGYQSNYKAPKSIDDYHDNWIKKLANKLIEEDVNNTAASLRNGLRYKRKDIQDPVIGDGVGQLTTVDFDYVVRVNQSSTKATKYILTRSIESFKNSSVVNRPEFNEIFASEFNKLEFDRGATQSVQEIIDKIEEIDDDEVITVEYEQSEITNCRVWLAGFGGILTITGQKVTIHSNVKRTPKQLVTICEEAYQLFTKLVINEM